MPDLTRQHQRFKHAPHKNQLGDCWRTAIACLLEIPRDEVPHFAQDDPQEDLTWWFKSVAFVESKLPNLTLKCYDADKLSFPVYIEGMALHKLIIANGPSPRGDFNHVVLLDAVTGEFYWDPSPTGKGLDEYKEFFAIDWKGTPNDRT